MPHYIDIVLSLVAYYLYFYKFKIHKKTWSLNINKKTTEILYIKKSILSNLFLLISTYIPHIYVLNTITLLFIGENNFSIDVYDFSLNLHYIILIIMLLKHKCKPIDYIYSFMFAYSIWGKALYTFSLIFIDKKQKNE